MAAAARHGQRSMEGDARRGAAHTPLRASARTPLRPPAHTAAWAGRPGTVRGPRSGVRCTAGVLLVMQLAAATVADAQPRETRTNRTGWLALFGDLEVAPNWFVDYEAQVRREGPVEHWQQFLPRLSVRYRFHPNAQLSWGVTTPETWPYGKTPVPYRFPERRMWEQLLLTHAAGRVALSHRYRLEQRWLGRVVEEGGEEVVANWVKSNRIRYRAAGIVPLRGATLDVGEPYANVNGELFVQWGSNVAGNIFDQYRLNAMIGWRLTQGVRLEAGYLEQLLLRPNGQQFERNHTIMLALITSQSLAR